MGWKNHLPALKGEIRGMLRAAEALVAHPPKSHDPVVVWFEKKVLNRFADSLPKTPKYADLRKNTEAVQKIFYNLISQDPYYHRAAIKLIYIIRNAPEPPVPEWMREWVKTHFMEGEK